MLAKETHRMYGSRSNADTFEYFLKNKMLARMAIHRIIISKKANIGFLNPKNNTDQRVLSINCPVNNKSPFLSTSLSGLVFQYK